MATIKIIKTTSVIPHTIRNKNRKKQNLTKNPSTNNTL